MNELDSSSEEKGAEVPRSSVWGNFVTAVKYVWADTKKNTKSFYIGCFTVTLVVFSLCLLQNSIDNAPIIFLKLAEDNVGEYDLVMVPNPQAGTTRSFTINSTEIEERLHGLTDTSAVAPRWLLLSQVINVKDPTYNGSAILLVIDSKKEKEIGLGREWTHPPLVGQTAHVSDSLLRLLHLHPNVTDELRLRFDFITMAYTLYGSGGSEKQFVSQMLSRVIEAAQNGPLANGSVSLRSMFSQLLAMTGTNLDTTTLNTLLDYLDRPSTRDLVLSVVQAQLSSYGISLSDLATINGTLSEASFQRLKRTLSFELQVAVQDGIRKPHGKFPEALGNVVVLEFDLWNSFVSQNILSLLDQFNIASIEQRLGISGLTTFFPALKSLESAVSLVRDRLGHAKMEEFAMTAIVMYKDRMTTWLKDKDNLEQDMIIWSDRVKEAVGLDYPISFQIPLIQALRVLYFLRLFLDQLLLIVVIFLTCIGMFLIYSLLIADVESKVYECGMLRALGMEQYTLIELLVIESLLFSVPGILVGIALASLAFIPIAYGFELYTVTHVSLVPKISSLLLGVAVGLVMPLVALVGPIQHALSKTLRDALDLYHSLSSDITVKFTKLENLGISPIQTYLSILAVSAGFVVYYLVPYSFFYFLWALFFNIFVGIMLAMVLGLAFLGMTVHPMMQRIIVHCLMWGKDKRCLKPLVIKNLQGHVRRNSKTATLYTVCIAFIIFSGTIFSQQAISLTSVAKIGIGADIIIQSLIDNIVLDYEPINAWLAAEKSREGSVVLDYAFSTFPIKSLPFARDGKIATLTDWPRKSVWVMGVSENFLDVVYDEYLGVVQYNKDFTYNKTRNGYLDIIRSLYSDRSTGFPEPQSIFTGKISEVSKYFNYYSDNQMSTKETYAMPIDGIISEALRTTVSADVNRKLELVWNVPTNKWNDLVQYSRLSFLLRPRAMVNRLPGFIYSSYPQSAELSYVLVSIPQYQEIMERCYKFSVFNATQAPPPPPMRGVYIRCTPDSNITQREDIINSLKSFIRDARAITTNMKDILESMQFAVFTLDLFFDVVAGIIVTMCFFMLIISFTSNITENAWEFGVLRALGLTASQVVRVYIYEALAIVFSSIIIGFVMGDLVSVTLTLESNLFNELPFQLRFPTLLFTTVVILSIGVALFGSYIPSRTLLKKRIASALKNTS